MAVSVAHYFPTMTSINLPIRFLLSTMCFDVLCSLLRQTTRANLQCRSSQTKYSWRRFRCVNIMSHSQTPPLCGSPFCHYQTVFDALFARQGEEDKDFKDTIECVMKNKKSFKLFLRIYIFCRWNPQVKQIERLNIPVGGSHASFF